MWLYSYINPALIPYKSSYLIQFFFCGNDCAFLAVQTQVFNACFLNFFKIQVLIKKYICTLDCEEGYAETCGIDFHRGGILVELYQGSFRCRDEVNF